MKRFYLLAVICFSSLAVYAQQPFPIWAHGIGGSDSDDYIESVFTDASGNVYIAGSFTGLVDFDQGSGAAEATSTDFSPDAFVAKYDPTGVFLWVKTWGGDGNDEVRAVVADASGVYVAGYFHGASVDFDDDPGLTTIRSSSSVDMFLVKFDPSNGALLFANTFGGTDIDYATGVALDAVGNVYMCGNFIDDVDFDLSGADQTRSSWGGWDIILAKYTSSGDYVWASDLGSTQDDYASAVFVQGTNVFVTGYYGEGSFYPDPNYASTQVPNSGGTDGYWGKYSTSTGALLIGATVSSSGDDGISGVWADGTSLYITGYFEDEAGVVGNGGNLFIESNGGADAFIARYNIADTHLIYAKAIGGLGDDYFNWITGDGTNLYVTGTFSDNMNLDPVNSNGPLINKGDYDAMYAKYVASTGAFVHGLAMGEADEEQGTSVAVGPTGYVVVAGIFSTNINVGAGVVRTSRGSLDGFVVKYYQGSEPLNQPTNITFPNTTGFGFTVSYQAAVGTNSGYLGIIKAGSAPSGSPVDGVSYNVGDVIGDGVVGFIGTQTQWNISSLGATPVAASTAYHVRIFAFNGAGSSTDYKTTGPLTGNTTTATAATQPAGQPENFATAAVGTTTFMVNFTAASGAPAGYIAIRGTGAVPTSDPVDGQVYTSGSTIGSGSDQVAYVGTALTFNETLLNPGTQYFYKIYSFNGAATATNYLTTTPLQGNVTTLGAVEPGSNPTAITFSNIASTSFDFSFTNVVGTTGTLVLRKAGSAPSFVPDDGVALTVGTTNSDGSVVAHVGTGGNLNFSGGTPGTTYHFALYSFNGTGANINYRQTDPLRNSTTTTTPPADATKPVVTDENSATTPPGVAVPITVLATDNIGVSSVKITFRPLNSGQETTGTMTKRADLNVYDFTIDAQYNTEQGVEYYVQATDAAGNKNDVVRKQVIVVYTDNTGLMIPYNPGTAKTNYRIISVPLNLNSKSVSDIFSDELGAYDKSKYRLFSYSGTAVTELSSSSNLELGKGYWFIAAESKNVDTGPGTTAQAGTNKPITIRVVNGWNLIGNPFNFNVDWDKVIAANTDKTLGNLRVFKGGWDNGDLEKLSGGFIHVTKEGDQQMVVPVLKDARTYKPTPENFSRELNSDTWAVDLILKSGSVTNKFGGFGMHPIANDLADRYDEFTLPRFMDYLELNHTKKFLNSNYTKDIVQTSDSHTWEFEVESNLGDDVMELTWDNSYFGSSDRHLVLFDVSQQRAIDMNSEDRYSFARGQSKQFRVFFGGADFVKRESLPYSAVFHSVSPVPSDGRNITLAFSVPETNGEVTTNVSIYNVMGQKVANLIDQALPGGYQQAVWNIEDGAKPAAGVYISVVKFGDTTLQKRLVIR